MKSFEINDAEGSSLQGQSWLRGEIISAWQHHEQVAVGGSALIWIALMLGEKRITEHDRNRLGVDPGLLREAWKKFKLTRVSMHKLRGMYIADSGGGWEVKINTKDDTATVTYMSKGHIEGYQLIYHPSLSEILMTLQRFGWNTGEGRTNGT